MILIKGMMRLFLLWPFYFLLKLFPRNKRVWCFSSYNDSFVDNSKYLFHFVNQECPEINAYWVSDDEKLIEELKSKGYKALKRKSIRGIAKVCQARVLVYSSYVSELGFWQSAGATKLNLWHGLPLKKIEFDIDSGVLEQKYSNKMNMKQLALRIFYPAAYVRPDFITAPTPSMAKIFKSAFRLNDSSIICSASPRTDQFFDVKGFEDLYTKSIVQTSARKTFVYMPTFRDSGKNIFTQPYFDFEKLQEVLIQIDGELLIKAHPAAGAETLNLSKYSRIRLLDSKNDMYPVLADSWALITDYSSIYIDYLLLDKPIYFYCFDLGEYLNTCRGMYFNYEEVTPGSRSQTFEQLLSAIISPDDSYKKERVEARDFFWGQDYKGACEKILRHVIDH